LNRPALALVATLALPACAAPRMPDTFRMPARELCLEDYVLATGGEPTLLRGLSELSGLAASPTDPDVFWTHNDSGNAPRLFAFAADGAPLGALRLSGVKGVDLEDLAAAPCPDRSGPCLWLADTGDNQRSRRSVAVHAIPEPKVSRGAPLARDAKAAPGWRFVVRYPDGPVDSEALFVLPDASAFYLVEKTGAATARLFRRSAEPGGTQEAQVVARIPAPGPGSGFARQITGADLHPGGQALVLRTYAAVIEYRLEGVADLARLGTLAPALVNPIGPLEEPQGEAVAYDGTGRGLLTVSEDPLRQGEVPLHVHRCE
jgi:hypothetical protein